MAILDDLRAAIDTYPDTSVDVSITDFSVLGGGVLNVGDKAQFKINVNNTGHLDMNNVTVRVNASSFADVSKDNITFVPNSVISAPMTVGSLGNQKTGFFQLKAKLTTGGIAKDIVSARIEGWNASLSHILDDHSGGGPNEGKLNKSILAT